MAAELEEYLVWSNEHGGWWRPENAGYSRDIREAGRYTHREAMVICARSIPGIPAKHGVLAELPVRIVDLELIRDLLDEVWRDPKLI